MRKTGNILNGCIITLAVLVLFSGCRKEPPVKPANGVVAVSLVTDKNPHFRKIAEAIETEARRHAYQVNVVSCEFSVDRQIEQVQHFISQHVQAIVLTPCDAKRIAPAIMAARAAAIPVFTADTAWSVEGVPVKAHVATDNRGGGKQIAHAIITYLGEKGGTVGLIHHSPLEACEQRVKGFLEVVTRHNETNPASRIEILFCEPGGANREGGAAAARTILNRHDLPDVIFAINDPSAAGAYSVLKKLPKEKCPQIIAFDGSKEGCRAVNEGHFLATAIQYPDRIGIEVMRSIVMNARNDPVPAEILIPTSLYQRPKGGKKEP